MAPDFVGHSRWLRVQRAGLQEIEAGVVHGPLDFYGHVHQVFDAAQQFAKFDGLGFAQAGLFGAGAGDDLRGGFSGVMDAADFVILAAGHHAEKFSVTGEFVAVGGYFALGYRRAEAPGCAQDHAAFRGLAEAAAGCAGVHERLNEDAHGGIGGVDIVSCHVAQGAGGPQRAPAGTDGGDEVGFAFEAEIAFELAGEAGAEAVLDQGGGTHHGQRGCLFR